MVPGPDAYMGDCDLPPLLRPMNAPCCREGGVAAGQHKPTAAAGSEEGGPALRLKGCPSDSPSSSGEQSG